MKQETIDSVTSYSVGGFGVAVSQLHEVASTAQSIALILGCLVVFIRLLHDGTKLYRYWKGE